MNEIKQIGTQNTVCVICGAANNLWGVAINYGFGPATLWLPIVFCGKHKSGLHPRGLLKYLDKPTCYALLQLLPKGLDAFAGTTLSFTAYGQHQNQLGAQRPALPQIKE